MALLFPLNAPGLFRKSCHPDMGLSQSTLLGNHWFDARFRTRQFSCETSGLFFFFLDEHSQTQQ